MVGGGNHAVFLTEYASEVLLFESAGELTADDTPREEGRAESDVGVGTNAEVSSF